MTSSISDSPRIGMHLECASENDLTWHQEQRFVARVLEALEELGLWFDFTLMRLDDEDDEPLDRKRLVAAAEGGVGITLHSASREAYVDVSPHGIIAKLRLRTPPLGRRGKPVLDGIIRWAQLAAGTMGDRARVVNGNVYPLDPLSYPARRPPPYHRFVRFGTLVNFLGLSWCREAMPQDADAVAFAPLPAGATRTTDGDLVVLRWLDDPSDPLEQARGCILQEDWWASHVEVVPEVGWNALGDQLIAPTALEPRAPFTLFDVAGGFNEAGGVGYCAVVVQPDGELSGASWPEIARLTGMRELEDGTPVNHVRLIVPVRENATAIADKAREIGVDAVVYKDDENRLWNVMAKGNWRLPGAADSLPLAHKEPARKTERIRRSRSGKKR